MNGLLAVVVITIVHYKKRFLGIRIKLNESLDNYSKECKGFQQGLSLNCNVDMGATSGSSDTLMPGSESVSPW